jgi:2-polyprenyl-6-methoxyphenol hydroxylase-like FAD-dependent oxidoreductase
VLARLRDELVISPAGFEQYFVEVARVTEAPLNSRTTDMSSVSRSETAALVIGAGPVGLTMACELLRHGIPCRVIDQNEGPTPIAQSRALAIQARTMEALENVGATETILARGRKVHGIGGYHGDRCIVHLTLDLDALDTPYPFIFTLPLTSVIPLS